MLCQDRIIESHRIKLFEEYLNLTQHDKRSAYISSLISIQNTAIHRPRFQDPSKEKFRLKSYNYSLDIEGSKIKVCKGCFPKTFGETDNFVNLVATKK